MLMQITPEQIANNWDFLRTCIINNAPLQRDHKEQDNNILLALLSGVMQCWVEAIQHDEDNKLRTELRAVVITQVLEDPISNVSNLLIYSLYGFNNAFDISSWRKGILTLVRFARKMNCSRMLAYTSNESILTFMRKLGADDSQRIVILPFN